jgi:hypothetical protein
MIWGLWFITLIRLAAAPFWALQLAEDTHSRKRCVTISHLLTFDLSALKKSLRGAGRGKCGGVGCSRTPTYAFPPLEVDFFQRNHDLIMFVR